jgi:hypothetical protein
MKVEIDYTGWYIFEIVKSLTEGKPQKLTEEASFSYIFCGLNEDEVVGLIAVLERYRADNNVQIKEKKEGQ